MKNFINIFNFICLIFFTVLISVVTAIFYLGNEESYNALKRALPFTFFKRMLLGIMLGAILSLLLLIINWTYNRIFGGNKGAVNIKRLSLKLVISTLASSFVGSIIFFS